MGKNAAALADDLDSGEPVGDFLACGLGGVGTVYGVFPDIIGELLADRAGRRLRWVCCAHAI